MYVIMYHYVRNIRNSRYPKIKGLETDFFRQQINYLKNEGFRFTSVEEIKNRESLTDKSVLLTFDDGYIDHYLNVFPILYQNNIQGVFSMPGKIIREKKVLDVNKIHFILASANIAEIKEKLFARMNFYRGTEFTFATNEELYNKLAVPNRFDDGDTIFVKRILQVELPEQLRNIITEELFRGFVTDNEQAFVDELYMNMDQIRLMKKEGMIFGIHGYDHYWMNKLPENELVNDIGRAKEVFEGIIDPDDWICCYPYGSYSDDVITIVKNMGATSGLATDVGIYHPCVDNVYKIPRFDTNDFPPKSENYINF